MIVLDGQDKAWPRFLSPSHPSHSPEAFKQLYRLRVVSKQALFSHPHTIHTQV